VCNSHSLSALSLTHTHSGQAGKHCVFTFSIFPIQFPISISIFNFLKTFNVWILDSGFWILDFGFLMIGGI